MSNYCYHGTFLHFSFQMISFEYLLLPPRSVLKVVPLNITIKSFKTKTFTPAYTLRFHFNIFISMVKFKYHT